MRSQILKVRNCARYSIEFLVWRRALAVFKRACSISVNPKHGKTKHSKSLYTLGDIFTGNEIRGFLEKIPIFSYHQNFGLHFKIPQINFSVICSKRVKLRCIYQISYFTWSVRQGRTFLRYIES